MCSRQKTACSKFVYRSIEKNVFVHRETWQVDAIIAHHQRYRGKGHENPKNYVVLCLAFTVNYTTSELYDHITRSNEVNFISFTHVIFNISDAQLLACFCVPLINPEEANTALGWPYDKATIYVNQNITSTEKATFIIIRCLALSFVWTDSIIYFHIRHPLISEIY